MTSLYFKRSSNWWDERRTFYWVTCADFVLGSRQAYILEQGQRWADIGIFANEHVSWAQLFEEGLHRCPSNSEITHSLQWLKAVSRTMTYHCQLFRRQHRYPTAFFSSHRQYLIKQQDEGSGILSPFCSDLNLLSDLCDHYIFYPLFILVLCRSRKKWVPRCSENVTSCFFNLCHPARLLLPHVHTATHFSISKFDESTRACLGDKFWK